MMGAKWYDGIVSHVQGAFCYIIFMGMEKLLLAIWFPGLIELWVCDNLHRAKQPSSYIHCKI